MSDERGRLDIYEMNEKEIVSLLTIGQEGVLYRTFEADYGMKCEEIKAVEITGQMAYVPAFEIYRNGKVWKLVTYQAVEEITFKIFYEGDK